MKPIDNSRYKNINQFRNRLKCVKSSYFSILINFLIYAFYQSRVSIFWLKQSHLQVGLDATVLQVTRVWKLRLNRQFHYELSSFAFPTFEANCSIQCFNQSLYYS